MIRLQITGQTELAKALQGLTAKVRQEVALSAMEKAVEPVVVAAKSNILASGSVDTGGLYRSIGFAVRQYRRGVVTFGVIGARRGFGVADSSKKSGRTEPANYAHLVEYGHAVHGNASAWVEAKPFMRPAWDQTAPQVVAILSRELGQGIAAAATRSRRARRGPLKAAA